jgi:thiol-disulfide isomerase/thioredoxin
MAMKMTLKAHFSSAIFMLSMFGVIGVLGAAAPAMAQSSKKTTTQPVLMVKGTTLDKKKFELSQLKGNVVVLMFWSTDCPVCRDKMPELRRNVQGWADKPFELVLVSTDRSMADVDSYNAILNKSVPMKQRFTQLWTGDASYRDNQNLDPSASRQLPLTFILGKDGKVLQRIQGRVPVQIWDDIADLL